MTTHDDGPGLPMCAHGRTVSLEECPHSADVGWSRMRGSRRWGTAGAVVSEHGAWQMKDVIEFSDSDPLKTMQSFYIKDRSIGLTPNLIVVKNGQKWFETNSWGLKGSEPVPGKQV